MTIALCILSLAAGYAFCWFTKDAVTMSITGTTAFVTKLEAKAAALKAAL